MIGFATQIELTDSMVNDPTCQTVFVDGHAHLHDCFDVTKLLDGAVENFCSAARRSRTDGQWSGCLMFADNACQFSQQRLTDVNSRGLLRGWQICETEESCSLLARNDREQTLSLIFGRQIVSGEDIEVLALACEEEISDGLPLQTSLELACDAAAITVIPWGFGKWWYRRGRLVENLLRKHASGEFCNEFEFFVGDNSGRLRYTRQPRLIKFAGSHRIRNLPGSDALPLNSQNRACGRYGFVLSAPFDVGRPAASIKAGLQQRIEQPAIFGRRENAVRFCHHQFAMQCRKLRKRLI